MCRYCGYEKLAQLDSSLEKLLTHLRLMSWSDMKPEATRPPTCTPIPTTVFHLLQYPPSESHSPWLVCLLRPPRIPGWKPLTLLVDHGRQTSWDSARFVASFVTVGSVLGIVRACHPGPRIGKALPSLPSSRDHSCHHLPMAVGVMTHH